MPNEIAVLLINKAALAAGIALVVSLVLGPFLISVLRSLNFGQNIREEGPQHHRQKAGTPTIGGLIFIAGVLVAVLIVDWPLSGAALTCLITFCGFGVLGFLDDYIKVVKRRNMGLRGKQKLLGQILLVALLLFLAAELGRGTVVQVPFLNWSLDLGVFYYPFVAFLVVGIVNGVNLTDGVDGLAAGCVGFSALGYVAIILMILSRNLEQASGIAEVTASFTTMAHMSSLAIFAAALAGGCLGFLRYNAYPAKVFMGDCGSLALGGALGALAVLSRTEILLLVVGAVYVIEAFSVILQVVSFQTRQKRIFRMSPLHHHFELGGWSEKKVVGVFWIVSLAGAALGILGCR